MSKANKQKKAAKALQDLFFTQLDKIYETCETGAAQFGAKSVPLSYLKLCIDETKKGFEAGFKKKNQS